LIETLLTDLHSCLPNKLHSRPTLYFRTFTTRF